MLRRVNPWMERPLPLTVCLPSAVPNAAQDGECAVHDVSFIFDKVRSKNSAQLNQTITFTCEKQPKAAEAHLIRPRSIQSRLFSNLFGKHMKENLLSLAKQVGR